MTCSAEPTCDPRSLTVTPQRGIPTDPSEVLVTTGAQSAIHLLASVLLGRGDRVLIETPTYPHAADAFRSAGARLVGLPVTTSDGWDLDRAEQALARTLPVVAYLMPDFQNPTGRSMTAEDRAVILAAAERSGTLLVLDETTADLDIDRGAVSPGFVDADSGSVVRIGSLGKTVWGGLRVGWIRASADLVRRLIAARSTHDLGTPEFEQAVAAELLPRFGEIVAQRSHVLREGRDAAVDALRSALPEWSVPRPHGGVSLWIELDAPLSSAIVMDARSRGLLLSAGPRFSVDGGHDRHLRLPFTAPADELRRAVGILADAWPHVRGGAPDRRLRISSNRWCEAHRPSRRHSTASSADQNAPRSRNARLCRVEPARSIADPLVLGSRLEVPDDPAVAGRSRATAPRRRARGAPECRARRRGGANVVVCGECRS